jgi:hypothetical protein
MAEKQPGKADRKSRLAAALKANLKRRKAQNTQAKAAPSPPDQPRRPAPAPKQGSSG